MLLPQCFQFSWRDWEISPLFFGFWQEKRWLDYPSSSWLFPWLTNKKLRNLSQRKDSWKKEDCLWFFFILWDFDQRGGVNFLGNERKDNDTALVIVIRSKIAHCKSELLKLYLNWYGVECYFLLVPKCALRVTYFSVCFYSYM